MSSQSKAIEHLLSEYKTKKQDYENLTHDYSLSGEWHLAYQSDIRMRMCINFIRDLEKAITTEDKDVDKAIKPNTIEVPFRLDPDGDVMFRDDNNATSCFYSILSDLNIDQTKIERITLTMREEE